MKLEPTQLSSVLAASGVEPLSVEEESAIGIVIRLNAADAKTALQALRDSELQFEMLLDTFGADMAEDEEIEVTYHLRSLSNDFDVRIKIRHPYDDEYQSVTSIYKSALLPERELCEMFGLFLEGHPNPKRMLTHEGLINPLRKSFEIRGREEIWSRYEK